MNIQSVFIMLCALAGFSACSGTPSVPAPASTAPQMVQKKVVEDPLVAVYGDMTLYLNPTLGLDMMGQNWEVKGVWDLMGTMLQLEQVAPGLVDVLVDENRAHNVLVIWALEQDLERGVNAENSVNGLWDLSDSRRAAGFDKIVVVTAIGPTLAPTQEAERDKANQLIRTLYPHFADSLYDIAADKYFDMSSKEVSSDGGKTLTVESYMRIQHDLGTLLERVVQ